MWLSHFTLEEQPFGVTPDPTFLYASPTHREALASLVYAIDAGLGFVTLTAKPGMGKTTLLFETLRRFKDKRKTVFLFQSISTADDLIRVLLHDLGVENSSRSFVEMQTHLNERLLDHYRAGARVLLVIDEAQNLNETVLEAVRLLSNFETSRDKLIQIVLSGQPQLDDKLASEQLLQLRQRISIHGRLQPFSLQETSAYIVHRLQAAGCVTPEHLFTRSSLAMIHESSGGIPRNINNICFNALSLAYATGHKTIDGDIIREVLSDLGLEREGATPKSSRELSPSSGDMPPKSAATRFLLRGAIFALVPALALMIFFSVKMLSIPSRAPSKPSPPEGNPTAASAAPSRASQQSAPAIPVASASSGSVVERDTQGSLRIKVRHGESLRRICAENLGRCDGETFRLLLRMNPSITNPDYIVSGQIISLPIQPAKAIDSK